MILVDTSVWVDHVRKSDEVLSDLLRRRRVYIHPFVVGELAVGNLPQRSDFIRFLQKFPEPVMARQDEILPFINNHHLYGRGLGFVDMHLLASTQLTPGAQLWTRDKRLHRVAESFGITYAAN